MCESTLVKAKTINKNLEFYLFQRDEAKRNEDNEMFLIYKEYIQDLKTELRDLLNSETDLSGGAHHGN